MEHRTFVITEGDLFGWVCEEPWCFREATGFEDQAAAESAAQEHERGMAEWAAR